MLGPQVGQGVPITVPNFCLRRDQSTMAALGCGNAPGAWALLGSVEPNCERVIRLADGPGSGVHSELRGLEVSTPIVEDRRAAAKP